MGRFISQTSFNNFILAIPSLVFISAALSPRFMAFLPAILGIIGVIQLLISRKPIILWKPAYILALGTILLAAASIIWSYNIEFSIERTIKIALQLSLGLLLPSLIISLKDELTLNLRSLILATLIPAAALSLFVIFEYYNDFYIYAALHPETDMSVKNFFIYNRSIVALTLLMVPTLLILFLNYHSLLKDKIVIVCLVPIIWALAITTSQTAQVGFLASLLLFFFFPIQNKAAQYFLSTVIIIGCLATPVAIRSLHAIDMGDEHTGIMQSASIPHRIEVWNFALTDGMQNIFYGSGVGSMRFFESETALQRYMHGTSVLHPHNVVVQAWQEFGLIGVILMLCGVMYIFKNIYGHEKDIARLFLAMFACYALMAMTGYSFWQGWIIGVVLIYCTLGLLYANVIFKSSAESEPNTAP